MSLLLIPESVERTIILPLKDNDGCPLDTEVDSILCELLDIVGGYSAYRQEGAWKDPVTGIVYYDRPSLCVTVISDNEQTDWIIDQKLYSWASLLKQICLLSPRRYVEKKLYYAKQVTA